MQMHTNLGQLFETVVSQNMEEYILTYSSGSNIKYSALNSISDKIALYYESIGLRKGDVVLLSGDKSILMFASIVAAFKLGIIYSIFDPDMPADRLKMIIQECEPTLLIVNANEHYEIGSECGVQAVPFTDLENKHIWTEISHTNLKREQPSGHDIVYIVFTSGSTGVPKGAVMTHSNVLALIEWSIAKFSFGPGEVLTNLNPCYFDNFVFDFYSSFFSGAALVPFTKQELLNPQLLIESIEIMGCTSWFSVPSTLIYLHSMKAFSSAKLSRLRRIIFGGEGYPKSKLLPLFNNYKKYVDFFNVYGPSECTCIASCYQVSDDDFLEMDGFLPIGKLIKGFSCLVINDKSEIVPDGETGVLCLIGNAVGVGYYNKPMLTRRSFVSKDDFIGLKGKESVYLTGDLVCKDVSNDNIFIYGRKDNQIKHMGYRVELEEIENALMRLTYVNQACCTHHCKDGFSRITAFVSISKEFPVFQIKTDLSNFLPSYMIPSVFSFVDLIPMNKNGKIDRRLLQSLAVNL